jgi:hypothetical protein
MIFKKDGKTQYNSKPLEGITSDSEAKERAETIYKIQDMGQALSTGKVLAVYKYNLSSGPVSGDFTSVQENGFDDVGIKTYEQWTGMAGGKKKVKKTAAKKTTAKKPTAKKTTTRKTK